jgi:peptidoglycan/xylan/chitin deacetylase (PgdA/CDA1 family)
MLYHGFAADKDLAEPVFKEKFLRVSEFEQHLKLYLNYGTPVSLSDLALGKKMPPNPIVVTIDDGYANNYFLGFPVLKKYNIPATIFLTTSFICGETFLWTDWLEYVLMQAEDRNDIFKWNNKAFPINLLSKNARKHCLLSLKSMLKTIPKEEIMRFIESLQKVLRVELSFAKLPEGIQPLNWDQIKEMKESGLISFGSHTLSHPILSMCNAKTQRREIHESKLIIEEKLGNPCFMFAYPNGKRSDYSGETIEFLKETGYVLAVTTESGYNYVNFYERYELKRWGTDISVPDLAFLVSGCPLFLSRIGRSGRQVTFDNRNRTPSSRWKATP